MAATMTASVLGSTQQTVARCSAASRCTALLPAVPSRSAFAGRQLAAQSQPQHRAVRQQVVRAESKPEIAKVADNIGLPTDEGIFGFKPFAEVWVGRLAMMGFVTSIVFEGLTGRGTLQQIGLASPSQPVLALILGVTGGATLLGSVRTILRATGNTMSQPEMARYRKFLGITKEAVNIKQTEAAFKQAGDFTSPTNWSAIREQQTEGTPADKVLGMDDRAQAASERVQQGQEGGVLTLERGQEMKQVDDAARGMKRNVGPNMSLAARDDAVEQLAFTSNTLTYARQVEIANGRAAMLGFWAAIVVEAATGNGIIGQLIMWFKFVGLLGAESGF